MSSFFLNSCNRRAHNVIRNAMETPSNIRNVQHRLLQWFRKQGRDLPWRRTRNPYRIWISEIMLQQTQVDTVIPYYQRFLKAFPTVEVLAKADLSRVLKIWEGLGYYSRARHLHQAAKRIVGQFNGKIPHRLNDLLSLPGIGRYTAGAILSIAHNKEAPILDGNVKRVLSRVYAVSTPLRDLNTENFLWTLSESLIPKGHAGSFNEALMDLGATVCTPKKPSCPLCPLRNLCRAKAIGNPERYPTRIKRRKIPHVNGVSAVIVRNGKVLLHQRPPKGFSGGLWEFPNWRVQGEKSRSRRLLKGIKEERNLSVAVKDRIGIFEQTYSHFKLTLHVYHCQALEGEGSGRWVRIRDLHRFPMSRIHRRISQTILEDRKTRI
jgi:A/G-specific adenine glycosylase